VDSPVISGEIRVIDITRPASPFTRDRYGRDSEAALDMTPQPEADDQLVAESGRLFGARHYRELPLHFALSDMWRTSV